MAFNVLIVDDSAAMRNFIGRTLDLAGVPIGKRLDAANGEEALKVLRSEWVDIVLTDINMPQMNGEQLVRQLEQDEFLRSIPVIVVSTDGSEARVHQMMTLGARGYVTKPFSPETLRNEIEGVLGAGHD